MEEKPSENGGQTSNNTQYMLLLLLKLVLCTTLWADKPLIKVSGTEIYSEGHGLLCHRFEKCITSLLRVLLPCFLSLLSRTPSMLLLHGTLIVAGKAFMSCQSGPENDVWLASVQQRL